MAAWQHDYYLIPQAKLKEFYSQIPESVPENDYNKFQWWAGVSGPDPLEIEKMLTPATSWSEKVKIWGSDRGNRFSLYYGEDGTLQSVELRIDLRQEFPAIREFVSAMAKYADVNMWCFCTQGLGILMPDYEVLAKDMNLSSAQEFIDTHPAAPHVDHL